ncbi:MAG TPA: isoprenylcysteine carboxylmethyltransferase family protein [Acidobacteriaceae bacterium]|jgi:protein-S-isoprenylcysteine O-methyltransferase Ste14|nr:isoprenylcysteine carboxylmethyltransferase family protein [Acidobacteriaceae bacterium]
MKISQVVFRYRRWWILLIILLGFWAPLDRVSGQHPASTWLVLAGVLARYRVLPIGYAFIVIVVLATLFALAAAVLRTWGTAYLGSGVMQDPALHGERIVADGPYRYVRNPLYLGGELHILALAILMPPWGAIFTVIAMALLFAALIRAEEAHLIATRGDAYREYRSRVSCILPSLSARVPAGEERPRWGQALLAEIYFWGVAITYAALAYRYDGTILKQGVLVSFGLSIVARAFVRRPVADEG